jgi:hypothetical protein
LKALQTLSPENRKSLVHLEDMIWKIEEPELQSKLREFVRQMRLPSDKCMVEARSFVELVVERLFKDKGLGKLEKGIAQNIEKVVKGDLVGGYGTEMHTLNDYGGYAAHDVPIKKRTFAEWTNKHFGIAISSVELLAGYCPNQAQNIYFCVQPFPVQTYRISFTSSKTNRP